MNAVVVRLYSSEDPSRTKTLSAAVNDNLIHLQKQWIAEYGGNATNICLRSADGEFHIRNDKPIGSLLTKDVVGILELTVVPTSAVSVNIIGFPEMSDLTLEIPLAASPINFASILCYRLRLPQRNMKCYLGDKILLNDEPLSEQGVSKGSEIACDLQFHILVERVPELSQDSHTVTYDIQCFGSENIECLVSDANSMIGRYRLLLHSQPLSMDGSIANALREHGGLRRWHWVLQLEKQLSLEVLYPPPQGLVQRQVWPTDYVDKLIGESGESLLLGNQRLDPNSSFQELKVKSSSRLWVARTIRIKIENSRGVMQELQIPDSADVTTLRQQVGAMEPNQRFALQYDNAALTPEDRLLNRCGISDGAVIKLVRRQLAVILSYHGKHYSLGYVDHGISYEELLSIASQVLSTDLDQETVFECATCKRTVSMETKAQRRLPEACCEVTPRLLRIHRPTEIKLQVSMNSDSNKKVDHDFNRSTACTIYDLMAFVTDQLQRERNLAEDGEDFVVPLSEVSDLHDCVSLQIVANVRDDEDHESQLVTLKTNVSQQLSRTTKWWWDVLSWFRSHDNSETRKPNIACNQPLDDENDLYRAAGSSINEFEDVVAPKGSPKLRDLDRIAKRKSKRISGEETKKTAETSFSMPARLRRERMASENSYANNEVEETITHDTDRQQSTKLFDSKALDVTLSRDSKFIIKYLQSGGNVNSLLSDGTTLLAVAAMSGNEESLNILLDAGAAVNGVCKSGITSLQFAAAYGHISVVQCLLDKGASVDTKLKDGFTALLLAIENRHPKIVQKLLSHGANPNAALNNGICGLYIATELDQIQIAKHLIAHSANVDFARATGATPLFIAAQSGHTEMARFLLRNGAQINKSMRNGATPLYIACQNGHWEMVCFLVNSNANIDIAMENGATPLLSCAQNGQAEILSFLLRNNAQINASCNDGTTPLFVAAQNGHLEATKKLILSGADVSKTCDNGASPLYISCQNGHEDVARLLLEYGADVNAMCKDGSSPVYVAAQNGHTDIIHLLIEYRADVRMARRDKTTPLRIAHQQGHFEITDILKDRQSFLPSCIQM